MKRNTWIIPLIVIGIFVGIVYALTNQPKTVEVIQAKRRDVIRTLAVTGQAEAISNTNLSSTINGIQVLKTLVDKGDRVKAGQPLIKLDDRELRAALAKAEAQRRVSEANALKADANLETTLANLKRTNAQSIGSKRSANLAKEALAESLDLKSVRDQAKANVQISKERLAQSTENLTRTREGARLQAVKSAQAEVKRLESQLRLATLTLDRSKRLLDEGATSQADTDVARTNVESLNETLNQAKEQVIQLAIPRTEDVNQAEAATREAEAAVGNSETSLSNAERAYKNRTALRQQLNLAETDQRSSSASVDSAESEIKQAKAGVIAARADFLQSQANVELAKTQLSKTTLKSPVDGVVTDRKVEPGETVSNTKILLSIATPKRLRIKVDIDETNLHDIYIGQRAVIAPDAYPKLRLEGKIVEIIPAANSERGTVEVRISLEDQNSPIVPQLTADVNIFTGVFHKSLTLPRDCIIDPDTNPKVRLVSGGKVIEKRIKMQYGDVGSVMVEEGVSETDLILLNPIASKPDDSVKTKLVNQEPKS